MQKEMTRQWECESKILYSIIVAGKTAIFADQKTKQLLENCLPEEMPFNMLRRLILTNQLELIIRKVGVGNYTKFSIAVRELLNSNIDFETCKPEDLEKIKGIGPKTSRFFIMWIRPGETYAALDVHILRWLRNLGYDAPKHTPTNKKKYSELEKAFIEEAKAHGRTPRQLDLEIWEDGSKRKNNVPEQEIDDAIST